MSERVADMLDNVLLTPFVRWMFWFQTNILSTENVSQTSSNLPATLSDIVEPTNFTQHISMLERVYINVRTGVALQNKSKVFAAMIIVLAQFVVKIEFWCPWENDVYPVR